MKTLTKSPTTKDGIVGKKTDLKLTQLRRTQTTVIDNKKGSVDFHDEYFFGYTDKKTGDQRHNLDFEDLEARYGLL